MDEAKRDILTQARTSLRIPPRWGAAAMVLLVTLILVARYPLMFVPGESRLPQDFNVYMLARDAVVAGDSPYDITARLPYKYSPGVMAPLLLLPSDSGYAWLVFAYLSIFGFAAALFFAARYERWRDVGFLALGVLICWKGIIETMDFGQFEAVMFSIVVASVAMMRRFPFAAGLAAGTLPWIKLPWLVVPFALLVWAWPDVEGRFRRIAGGFAAGSAFWLVAAPSFVFGLGNVPEMTRQWMELVRAQPTFLFVSDDFNQGFPTTFHRWMIQGGWEAPGEMLASRGAALVATGVLLGRLIFLTLHSKLPRDPLLWVTGWMGFLLVVSPMSWRWSSLMMVAAPLAAMAFRDSGAKPWFRGRVGVGFLVSGIGAFWLLQQTPFVQMIGLNHWTELHPWGSVTMFWTFLLLLVL